MQSQSQSQDLTFITNEKNQNLANRFRTLIKDTQFFDVLVGYFYTSGFTKFTNHSKKQKKLEFWSG